MSSPHSLTCPAYMAPSLVGSSAAVYMAIAAMMFSSYIHVRLGRLPQGFAMTLNPLMLSSVTAPHHVCRLCIMHPFASTHPV